MTQLLKKLFHKQEQQEAVHPPSPSQYDDGYITYCVEQEIAIARLESALHKSDNPDEIAVQTLKTACDFYGANWAGIIELDLELGVTTPGWWYNTDPTIKKLQRMSEFENLSPMQTWKKSIRNGDPIIIPDVAEVARTSPLEYPVYKRMGVDALVAVPFGPNPLGFLVLRNPTKYITLTSTLNTLAYVMHRAMAQRDMINRRRMALSPEEIETDKDIIINFFGDVEICTQLGVWKENEFNSPKCCRAAVYILLHGKSAHSALAIADALSTEDTSDVDTINKNVRAYMYRFRKSFDPISKHKLIEYTANGYRVNPNLNIKTDLRQFENLWELTQQNIPIPQKVHTLKQAIRLYRGSVFASSCDDHWLVGIATEYKMKYIGMVNELLEILAQFEDYGGIQHYATKALALVPENVKAHYWLIYAMYHSGAITIAKQEFQQSKALLTDEEFASLKNFIRKDGTLQHGQIFDE